MAAGGADVPRSESIRDALRSNSHETVLGLVSSSGELAEVLGMAILAKSRPDLVEEVVLHASNDAIEGNLGEAIVSSLLKGTKSVQDDAESAVQFFALLRAGMERFGPDVLPESVATSILGMTAIHPRVTEAAELVFRGFETRMGKTPLWCRLVAVHVLRDAKSAARLFHSGVLPFAPGHAVVQELVQFGSRENLAGAVKEGGVFPAVERKLSEWNAGNATRTAETQAEAREEAKLAMRRVAIAIFDMCGEGSSEEAELLLSGGMERGGDVQSVAATPFHLLSLLSPNEEFLAAAREAFRTDAPPVVRAFADWCWGGRLCVHQNWVSEVSGLSLQRQLALGPVWKDVQEVIQGVPLQESTVFDKLNGSDVGDDEDDVAVDERWMSTSHKKQHGKKKRGSTRPRFVSPPLVQVLAARVANLCVALSAIGVFKVEIFKFALEELRSLRASSALLPDEVVTATLSIRAALADVGRSPLVTCSADTRTKLFVCAEQNKPLPNQSIPDLCCFWALHGAKLSGKLLEQFQSKPLSSSIRDAMDRLVTLPIGSHAVELPKSKIVDLSALQFASFGVPSPVFFATRLPSEEQMVQFRQRCLAALPSRAFLNTFLGRSLGESSLTRRSIESVPDEAILREAEESLTTTDAVVPPEFASPDALVATPVVLLAVEGSFFQFLESGRILPGLDVRRLAPQDLTPSHVLTLNTDLVDPITTLEPPFNPNLRGDHHDRAWRAVCFRDEALRGGLLGGLYADACRLYSERMAETLEFLSSDSVRKALKDKGVDLPPISLSGAAPRSSLLVLENARFGQIRALDVLAEFLHRPNDTDQLIQTLHGDLWAAALVFVPKGSSDDAEQMKDALLHRTVSETEMPIHFHTPVVCGVISLCRALRNASAARNASHDSPRDATHDQSREEFVDALESVALHVVHGALARGSAGARSVAVSTPRTSVVLPILLGARENGLEDVANLAFSVVTSGRWPDIRNSTLPLNDMLRLVGCLELLHWRDQVRIIRCAVSASSFPNRDERLSFVLSHVAKRWCTILGASEEDEEKMAPPSRSEMEKDDDSILEHGEHLSELGRCLKEFDSAARKSSLPQNVRLAVARYVFLALTRTIEGNPISSYDEWYFEGKDGVMAIPVTGSIQLECHAAFVMGSIADSLFRTPDGSVLGPVSRSHGDSVPVLVDFYAHQAAKTLGLLGRPQSWEKPGPDASDPLSIILKHESMLNVSPSMLRRVASWFPHDNSKFPEDPIMIATHAWMSEQRRLNNPAYQNPSIIHSLYQILHIPYASRPSLAQLLLDHGTTAPPPPEILPLVAVRDSIAETQPNGSPWTLQARFEKYQSFAEAYVRHANLPWDTSNFFTAIKPRILNE